ncbi:ABC transporter I family member 19 [Tetrabaena socialis]|uniref:ABC transporter I family member 19 n=1 Tax=Tetrabaena socialis TaxID=47790 RepID=A0A2J7ZS98_9CHLO|nr:ABC transporter I family member 19 [Tetrabaena socialis]|eukprot:PNH03149.1 ABC transporter I family member 19 [Tetrabaena socialis]
MTCQENMPSTSGAGEGIGLDAVSYAYPGCAPFIKKCSLDLPRGSRCLLIGANGAGKTTLLQIVAGKYMVAKESVRVLGRSPFHDLQLTCAGQLSYLGTSWRKDVAFAGYGVPMQADISAGKMLFGVEGVDPARRARLVEMLDIDLYQRITTMSDGQKRRVQIAMGLLKPYEVLLLDEITVDLDVVGRLRLLDFFRQESEERGATILYATHIFDGLEGWVTHVAYMEEGALVKGGPVAEFHEAAATAAAAAAAGAAGPGGAGAAAAAAGGGKKLLHVVEEWLRVEREGRLARKAAAEAAGVAPVSTETAVRPQRTPYMPSKHLAFFR